VILMDAGPLCAIFDKSQQETHARCVAALKNIRIPLVTTWACMAEAMYLLYRAGGYMAQEKLWQMRATGRLSVHELTAIEGDRMREVMAQYRDTPMDLADACLIAAAETLALRRVFTIDGHFHAYRTADGQALEVIP